MTMKYFRSVKTSQFKMEMQGQNDALSMLEPHEIKPEKLDIKRCKFNSKASFRKSSLATK